MAGDSLYKFPEITGLRMMVPLQCLDKITEEATEACEAYLSYLRAEDEEAKERARRNYGMGLIDLAHAAESAIRNGFNDREVEMLMKDCIEKNRARGCYDTL